MKQNAVLALEDGSLFWGKAIGAEGSTVGEVVFNTSMTGYQEILTDPSYAKQMVTLTYPHIGNTGTNPEYEEANSILAESDREIIIVAYRDLDSEDFKILWPSDLTEFVVT